MNRRFRKVIVNLDVVCFMLTTGRRFEVESGIPKGATIFSFKNIERQIFQVIFYDSSFDLLKIDQEIPEIVLKFKDAK